MAAHNILLLPGDGIGPEIMEEIHRFFTWFEKRGVAEFSFDTDLVGGASIDAHGVPLTASALAKARGAMLGIG